MLEKDEVRLPVRLIEAVKNLRVMREVKAVVQTQYNSILTTAFPDSDLDQVFKVFSKRRLLPPLTNLAFKVSLR